MTGPKPPESAAVPSDALSGLSPARGPRRRANTPRPGHRRLGSHASREGSASRGRARNLRAARLPRGSRPDSGVDASRARRPAEPVGHRFTVKLREHSTVLGTLSTGSRVPASRRRVRSLYHGRAAVEREFGRLKHDYGLSRLRVRGLERVALHADLTMLARLSQALARARARAVPLAA
jgi:hypothetical protein